MKILRPINDSPETSRGSGNSRMLGGGRTLEIVSDLWRSDFEC